MWGWRVFTFTMLQNSPQNLLLKMHKHMTWVVLLLRVSLQRMPPQAKVLSTRLVSYVIIIKYNIVVLNFQKVLFETRISISFSHICDYDIGRKFELCILWYLCQLLPQYTSFLSFAFEWKIPKAYATFRTYSHPNGSPGKQLQEK